MHTEDGQVTLGAPPLSAMIDTGPTWSSDGEPLFAAISWSYCALPGDDDRWLGIDVTDTNLGVTATEIVTLALPSGTCPHDPVPACCYCIDGGLWQCEVWDAGAQACVDQGAATWDPDCPEAATPDTNDDAYCSAVCA